MKATQIKLNTEIYAQTTRKDGKWWNRVLVLEIGKTSTRQGQCKVVFAKSHWAMTEMEKALVKQGHTFWNTENPQWVTLASIKDTAENHQKALQAKDEAERLAREKAEQAYKDATEYRKTVLAKWNSNEKLKSIAGTYSIDSYKFGFKMREGKHIAEFKYSELDALINYITELENTIAEKAGK